MELQLCAPLEVTMKVDIEHSTVKRNQEIYYVAATVQFSEEEKAIIRARGIGERLFVFESGLINMPPEAFSSAPLGVIRLATRLMGIGAVIFFFVAPFITPFPFIICLIGALTLFFYRKKIERAQNRIDKQELPVKEMVKGPFSVCTLNSLQIPPIEHEITANLKILKDMIVQSTEAPTPKTVKI